MKFIVQGIGTGKTTALIRRAAELDALGHVAYIVTPDRQRARRVSELAKSMSIEVRFPFTWYEFIGGLFGRRAGRVLIDDLDECLRRHAGRASIDCATADEPEPES